MEYLLAVPELICVIFSVVCFVQARKTHKKGYILSSVRNGSIKLSKEEAPFRFWQFVGGLYAASAFIILLALALFIIRLVEGGSPLTAL